MLTRNCLNRILDGAKSPTFVPTVQILAITKARNSNRVVISDGDFFCQTLCSIETLSQEIEINRHDIIELIDYDLCTVNNTKLIFIKGIKKIQPHFESIGSPTLLEKKVEGISASATTYSINEPPTSNLANPTPAPSTISQPQSRSSIQRTPSPHQIREPNRSVESQLDDDELYLPICALNLTSSDWTIKARVLEKSSIRSWDKPNSKGKLFDCILTDRKGDQIKGVFFNAAVELFFDLIQVSEVYTFSGGYVRSSNKAYSSIVNDIEINFDKSSTIRKVREDQNIPKIAFNFIFIDYLPKLSINSTVDICGIVCEISDTVKLNAKNGGELIKRNLVVSDHTECSIEITLWNDLAELQEFNSLDLGDRPILVFKNLKLKDYNKFSLSSERLISKVIFNTDGIKEAEFLKSWKAERRRVCPNTPLTEKKELNADLKTAAEIKAEWNNPLIYTKTEYFRMIGVLGKIQLSDEKPIWYQSCTRCKKKVMSDSSGNFNCESCGSSSPMCEFRYICNLAISDCTGFIYATAFDDVMTSLIGVPAKEFHNIVLNNLSEAEDLVFSVSCKYVNLVINCKENEGPSAYKFTIKRLDKFIPSNITRLLLKDLLMS